MERHGKVSDLYPPINHQNNLSPRHPQHKRVHYAKKGDNSVTLDNCWFYNHSGSDPVRSTYSSQNNVPFLKIHSVSNNKGLAGYSLLSMCNILRLLDTLHLFQDLGIGHLLAGTAVFFNMHGFIGLAPPIVMTPPIVPFQTFHQVCLAIISSWLQPMS
jgi:hypothetical protein